MTIKELNRAKTPVVKIDKRLNKVAGKNLFPEKQEKANKDLGSAELPKPTGRPARQNDSRNGKPPRLVHS